MDHAPLHHSEVQRDVDDMEICFLCRLEVYYKLGGLGQADSNIKRILEIKKIKKIKNANLSAKYSNGVENEMVPPTPTPPPNKD